MMRTRHEILAALGFPPPAWMRDAGCVEHPELSWFPEQGDPIKALQEVCTACLVRADCLEYAMAGGPAIRGVWAGTSERARGRLRAERDRYQPTTASTEGAAA